MFIKDYKKFLKYFGKGYKLKLSIFTVLSVFAGLMEFLGISLIYPFVVLVIKPDAIINKGIYIKFQTFTGIEDITINALILGFFIMLLFIVKNIYMIYFNFLQNKLTFTWKMDIVNQFMKYFLYSNYQDSIKISQTNKSYLLKIICPEAINVCSSKIISFGVNFIIVLMIVALIFIKYPIAGISTAIFVLIGINLQNIKFKHKLAFLKNKINEEKKVFNHIISTNLGNIKEIKILSAEKKFYDTYCAEATKLNNLQIIQKFYNKIPQHLMEIFVVFALIIFGGIICMENLHNQAHIIASFALLATAMLRLVPAMNRIQSALIAISSGETYVKSLLDYYEKFEMNKFNVIENAEPLPFKDKIEMKNITFGYDNDSLVLNNISLEIHKGDFLGIIEESGASKTALAEILTGLLPLKQGEIYIDGKKLEDKDFFGLRRILCYVPQQTKFLKTTIKENVAWGDTTKKIDENEVITALQEAGLSDFISEEPDGINLDIPKKNLSSKQKQGLAIARAIYTNPKIILLDGVSSGFDTQTETNLRKNRTVILISSKLSALKTCNKIVYLKKGVIVDIGSFEELSEKYPDLSDK